MSLYRLNPCQPIFQTKESEGIPIDSQNIFHKDCNIEVYMHPTGERGNMCISPNNAAFLMSIATPLMSFFGVTIIPYGNHEGKLVLAL